MKHSIRKLSTSIYIEYITGNYTSNLLAKNIEYENNNGLLELFLDLESNFRTNNKATNTYLDAVQLLESHDKLSLLQISHKSVIQVIKNNKLLFQNLTLTIHIKDNIKRSFQVIPKLTDCSLLLKFK